MKFHFLFALALMITGELSFAGCRADVRGAAGTAALREWEEPLNNEFERRGIDSAQTIPLSDAYSICVRYHDTCAPLAALSQAFSVVSPDQVYEVAEFLYGIHRDLEGQNRGPFTFQTVEILPRSESGEFAKMRLRGSSVLEIRVPSLYLVGYRAISAAKLRNLWDSGAAFTYFSIERARWNYLNPVGRTRSEIRQTLRAAKARVKRAVGAIRSIAHQNPELAVAQIKSLVKPGTLDQASQAKLDHVANLQLDDLLADWERNAESVELAQHLETAALSGASPRVFDVHARSWVVNVMNVKHVSVGVGSQSFGKYVLADPLLRPTTRTTSFGGLVNVALHDDVLVGVDLSGSLETAALELALRNR